MVANMTHGGRVAMLGLPDDEFSVDLPQVVLNMLTLKGVYGREMFETWYEMSVLLQAGLDISHVITHRLPYTDSEEAFDAAAPASAARSCWTGPRSLMFTAARAPDRRLDEIRKAGLDKHERVMPSPQRSMSPCWTDSVLNLCANNYLGLADDPALIEAARTRSTAGASAWPRCDSSAARRSRTKRLEAGLSDFLGTEDTILYSSCFDANGGVFETLLGEEDAVISDALNHASIIDGIRLCKASRLRYGNRDMADLEGSSRRRRRPVPADRHGRCLLDGRLRRAAARDLRARREV